MISEIVDIKGEVELDKESGGACETQTGIDTHVYTWIVTKVLGIFFQNGIATKGLAEILKAEGLIGKDTVKGKD